ncbi:aspartate/glutamate racemase family protein [Microbacterium paraoxydans]|uniref:aspartate/glutamate racemase family protein n=1 Tax=Microbacterium paraoxydans TaxID=199592 RepID=UPI000468BEEF|nr:aspartate/glutamate racemase family protein [Microbacterium paraoxydans]
MLGIIRVLTTTDEAVLGEHSRLMRESHGIDSVSRCIADQPHGIYNDESEAVAAPKILELAAELGSRPDVDAISISCAADPALIEARSALDIPVFGAGECGAYAAMMVADRVAVIGIGDDLPERMRTILGDRFHSYRVSPEHRRSTDLFADDALDALTRLAQQAVDEGAGAILFACTGFSTIGLQAHLASSIQIPVIDLVQSQAVAYSLISKA